MNIRGTTTVAVLALSLSACAAGGLRNPLVRSAPVCADRTVQIYFEPDSAGISREGAAVIRAAAQGARACHLVGVEVLGLADATGAADANLELSKQRASAVSAALTAAGLPATDLKISAAGDAGAVNRLGQDRPLRRRVDVVLRLSRP